MRRNITGVNEIQRLAYLQAMGIDSYVSRAQLPAAAPSRRLRLVRRRRPDMRQAGVATSAGVPAPSPASGGQPATQALKEALAPAPAPAAANTVADQVPQAAAAASQVPIFSVLATSAGGWYWLDEIPPGREPGAEYARLLQAICLALGLDGEAPAVEQFNWPLNSSGHLDQSDDAARDGFGGFLTGRLERVAPRGVVLMGAFDAGWFDRALLGDLTVVATVSAWRMLRESGLKPQAWRELQALRGDGD